MQTHMPTHKQQQRCIDYFWLVRSCGGAYYSYRAIENEQCKGAAIISPQKHQLDNGDRNSFNEEKGLRSTLAQKYIAVSYLGVSTANKLTSMARFSNARTNIPRAYSTLLCCLGTGGGSVWVLYWHTVNC